MRLTGADPLDDDDEVASAFAEDRGPGPAARAGGRVRARPRGRGARGVAWASRPGRCWSAARAPFRAAVAGAAGVAVAAALLFPWTLDFVRLGDHWSALAGVPTTLDGSLGLGALPPLRDRARSAPRPSGGRSCWPPPSRWSSGAAGGCGGPPGCGWWRWPASARRGPRAGAGSRAAFQAPEVLLAPAAAGAGRVGRPRHGGVRHRPAPLPLRLAPGRLRRRRGRGRRGHAPGAGRRGRRPVAHAVRRAWRRRSVGRARRSERARSGSSGWATPPRCPLDGWELGGGLAYATSRNGPPDTIDLWPGPETRADARIPTALEVARRGDTTRLGHLLAPMAVRYLVVTGAAGSRAHPGAAHARCPPSSRVRSRRRSTSSWCRRTRR